MLLVLHLMKLQHYILKLYLVVIFFTAGPEERMKAIKEKVSSLQETETNNASEHGTF